MNNAAGPKLVTTSFDFDGGRQVTLSVPAISVEAIVYVGDGSTLAQWGSGLLTPGIPATMIIGIHATASDDEMVRIGEYSPTIEPDRFAAHERFVIEDVRPWVQQEFDLDLTPARSAICGASAGGELALALGLRHPEIFGNVFCMSPGGGYQPPERWPSILPRFYFTAGTKEPWFRENAARWAEALESVGAEVMMTERDGDHGDPFWAEEFPRMVNWAFSEERS